MWYMAPVQCRALFHGCETFFPGVFFQFSIFFSNTPIPSAVSEPTTAHNRRQLAHDSHRLVHNRRQLV